MLAAVGINRELKQWQRRRQRERLSQNINSRCCNLFVTISTFLMLQGSVISSKMTLVGTALNLGGKKWKFILKCWRSYWTSNLAISRSVVVLQTTAKKWTKVKNARAGRAKLLFLPTKYAHLWHSRCPCHCRCSFEQRRRLGLEWPCTRASALHLVRYVCCRHPENNDV